MKALTRLKRLECFYIVTFFTVIVNFLLIFFLKSKITVINSTISNIGFGFIAFGAILIFIMNIIFLKQFYVLGIFFMKTIRKDMKISEGKFKCWLTLLTIWISLSLMMDYWFWVVNDWLKSMRIKGGRYAFISMIV